MHDLTLLNDSQWENIQPLLPPRPGLGRPRADDRLVLEGILWVLRSGARWRDLPERYRERQHLLETAARLGRGRGLAQHLATVSGRTRRPRKAQLG